VYEHQLKQNHFMNDVIRFLQNNFKRQPFLNEVSVDVAAYPENLQHVFAEWAGNTPQEFLQSVAVENAKKILLKIQTNRMLPANEDVRELIGLNERFMEIEEMMPDECKNGGENLEISFQFYETVLGRILVAATAKGICFIAFVDDDERQLGILQNTFPNSRLMCVNDKMHLSVLPFFNGDKENLLPVKLHLKGTVFQLKVWKALLKINPGELFSYAAVADEIGMPTATRAVGTAIGKNQVAYLIPCHRVIQSSGVFGNFRWGSTLKTALIGWEVAAMNRSK
jgi:AraC family transcriptional regulator, regulatory protein of adaptative response / methylated-DNA-[protein]-cysteine methyltransferase